MVRNLLVFVVGFIVMLRRKLLLVLAALTMLMLVTALSSVLVMRGFLDDLEHVNSVAMVGTTTTGKLSESIAEIEAELNAFRWVNDRQPDLLMSSIESLNTQIDQLRSFYGNDPEGEAPYLRLLGAMAALEHQVFKIRNASTEDVILLTDIALNASNNMRQEISNHAGFALSQMNEEHQVATSRFRYIVIGIAVIFILLINISIIVLLRTASFVIQPVDRLLEASRHLANEDYAYRVEICRNDEFDELATAFNILAQQLQMNEQRKVDTLHQVARTLNHELNNAISIIELQLRIVTKSPGYDHASGEQLRLIHETLHQMNETVTSLTKVRQVVLTDYIEGVKMLDLERSVQLKTPTRLAPKSGTKAHSV